MAFSVQNNALQSHEKTWRKQCILLSQRSQSEKGCILYDSKYMAFWEVQNRGDWKEIDGYQCLWRRRDEGAKQNF